MSDQSSLPFLMAVEDFFTHPGKGLRASGRIESGAIQLGDLVEVVSERATASFAVAGIAAGRRDVERAQAGDTVDVQLGGAGPRDVVHGDVLASPGSVTVHQRFSADVHLLSREEGGRHTPIFPGYRPVFRFHGRGYADRAEFPAEVDIAHPGDDVRLEVALVARVAINVGQRFTIHEDGLTVGSGIVSSIS